MSWSDSNFTSRHLRSLGVSFMLLAMPAAFGVVLTRFGGAGGGGGGG